MRRNSNPILDLPTFGSKYKFGLKRSKITDNDKVGMLHYEQVALPNKFDLRDYYKIEPYNQLHTNSCSANAISNQLKIILQNVQSKIEPSRAFIYFNSLLFDRDKANSKAEIQDNGASLKSCFESLQKYKFCDEEYHKFDENTITSFPTYDAYLDAFNNDYIKSFSCIHPSLYTLKYILAVQKKAIVFGMAVYSNFEALDANNYVLSKPKIQDLYLGLHGVLMIGYDDTDETFIICNSHGKSFGLNGFFKIKTEYITDANLSFEFWVLN